jgi:hypothetical protein
LFQLLSSSTPAAIASPDLPISRAVALSRTVTYHNLFSVTFHVLLLVSSHYCFATLVLRDVLYNCTHSPPVVRPASQKDAQSSTCTRSHLFTFHMSPHDSSCIRFRLPPIQTTRSSAHFIYKLYMSVARSLVRKSIQISPSPFPYLQYSAPDGDTVRKPPGRSSFQYPNRPEFDPIKGTCIHTYT